MTVAPAVVAVAVTFFADLRRYLPKGADGPQTYTLPAGATVADLLARIGIPEGTELTAGLDGEVAPLDTILRDGAELMLLSPMDGGCAR